MPGTTPMHRAPLGQPIGSTRNHQNRSQIPTTTHRPSQSYNGHPSSLQQTSASVSRQQSAHSSGRSTSGNYGMQAGMKIGAVPGGSTFVQRPASHAGGECSRIVIFEVCLLMITRCVGWQRLASWIPWPRAAIWYILPLRGYSRLTSPFRAHR